MSNLHKRCYLQRKGKTRGRTGLGASKHVNQSFVLECKILKVARWIYKPGPRRVVKAEDIHLGIIIKYLIFKAITPGKNHLE